MIYGTLFLTFLGALAAQVNPLVLKYTVDEVTKLTHLPHPMSEGIHILVVISVILLGKELLNIFINFGQKFYGEKIRINVSSILAQSAIDKILTYRVAYFNDENHESGKLQIRIDRGIESLTRLVQNFFIDMLPLFSNAIIALIIMYLQNVYVGIVSTIIVPIYFYVSSLQAKKLSGVRRTLRNQREQKTSGLLNLINSIMVIKSFVREKFEGKKQYDLQMQLMESQMFTRKTNFIYDGLKMFIEQFGVVLIILLTVYLVLDQQMTIGAIMLHIMLFNNVSAPIRQLHRIYDDMNDAMIYAEGYFDILNADDEKEPNGNFVEKDIKEIENWLKENNQSQEEIGREITFLKTLEPKSSPDYFSDFHKGELIDTKWLGLRNTGHCKLKNTYVNEADQLIFYYNAYQNGGKLTIRQDDA
ncbi:ABC transporter transmembrane domain-containing protein, partial [Chryseobacterium sp.]|uniref:ABC transporter transmembrane domain-containing protein n=1 Tax=Chryseobacterium sp. TaxID=1871047 RepID=UPI0035C73E9A